MMELSLTYAFILGLFHSLEPSHAKAVLASYFLNQKRMAWEAVVFALTVTLAHTLSIYVLAIIGYAIGPLLKHEAIEHWSELASGILMMMIGLWMFWNEQKAKFHKDDDEACEHGTSHGHFFHHHQYRHDHPNPSWWRQIFVLGFCSGAIPCMSGLAVLVAALNVSSTWIGILMVMNFSAGLGLVVLVMCLVMQQVPHLMDRYWKGAAQWNRFLPIFSAAIIFLVGVWVLLQAITHHS